MRREIYLKWRRTQIVFCRLYFDIYHIWYMLVWENRWSLFAMNADMRVVSVWLYCVSYISPVGSSRSKIEGWIDANAKTDVFKSLQILFACNYKIGSLGAGGCWGLATQLWAFSRSSVCSVWDSQCECRFQLLVCIQSCCFYLTIRQQASIQCCCPQQQLKPSGPCWEENLELFQNGGTKMEGKQPIRVSLLGHNRV